MNQIELASKTALIKKLSQDWKDLSALGATLCEKKIEFVNLGREMGIGLQAMCQHEQMPFSFYQSIQKDLPKEFSFKLVQKCVSLANALPEPVKTINEANRVESQIMLALGFTEEPHRNEIQQSHYQTPYTSVVNVFIRARADLFKQFSDSAEWDSDMRKSVREEVEKFEKIIQELKAKL